MTRIPETSQLKIILFIHVAMGAVAPTGAVPLPRLAATTGRTRASIADAALDRLAAEHPEVEVDADSLADSGDCDEALDALCNNEPDHRTGNLRLARAVRKAVREKTLPTSCPALTPDDGPITYTMLTNDSASQSEKRVRSPSIDR